jgi:fructuronate reductase
MISGLFAGFGRKGVTILPRLNNAALAAVPANIARPAYDRHAVDVGVVHFGPGAFHRAHQAWYIERLLARNRAWGICAVSLRNPELRDALAEQDNLYTLAVRGETVSYQVIGALREVLVAPEDPQAVLARLCAPGTRVVTLTITEKGYCLAADGTLDVTHPDIRKDFAHPRAPTSAIGFIAEALRRRHDAKLPPFTVVSCDNLADNGTRLARAVAQFAQATNPGLVQWIRDEVRFPRTMVDSITPATTPSLREAVAGALGLEDRQPVQREELLQWVMETGDGEAAPDWESVGVIRTPDVPAYERAKLRLVNGAHSTLAYTGLLMGRETVAQAIADGTLGGVVRALMLEDIVPTLKAPAGLDLHAYVRDILRRFANPGIRHELSQIAWDGSQKLPIRILGTVRDLLAAGKAPDRLCLALAAWMRFVRRAALRGDTLHDPLASELLEIGRACSGRASTDLPLFLKLEHVFPGDLRNEPRFVHPLEQLYDGNDTSTFALPPALRKALRGESS